MSWGTKGSDKAEALPSVASKKGKDETAVVVETQKNKEDLDAHFKETVTRAVTKLVSKEEIEKPTMDDENKTFRTRLVAFWMLTNAALAVFVERLDNQTVYFTIILFSTFALSMVRFVGVSFPSYSPLRFFLTNYSPLPVPVLLLQA